MHDKTYIWLGSRRAKRKSANPMALRLDLARNARLPVPAGIVLLDEAWHYAREQEWLRVDGTHVSFREPDFARELIMAASFDMPVQVTPSRAAPQPDMSRYHTTVHHPDEFAPAVAKAWSQMLSFERTADSRLDLVVTEIIAVVRQGSAATQADFNNDHVWEAPAFLTASLPKLGISTKTQEDAVQRRLQQLLRGVRTTFGKKNWLIEWADDGKTCWLLAIWEIEADWQRQDEFLVWPAFIGVELPEAFAMRANEICQEELELSGNRSLFQILDHKLHFNHSYLTEFWQGLGLRSEWDADSGYYRFDGAPPWSRLWQHPLLASRILYWRHRFPAWLSREIEKPHSHHSLCELFVRSLCRWQLLMAGSAGATAPAELNQLHKAVRGAEQASEA